MTQSVHDAREPATAQPALSFAPESASGVLVASSTDKDSTAQDTSFWELFGGFEASDLRAD